MSSHTLEVEVGLTLQDRGIWYGAWGFTGGSCGLGIRVLDLRP